jgi:hypothetical protein
MHYFPLTVLDNEGAAIVTTIEISPGRIIVIENDHAFFASDIQTLERLAQPLPSLKYHTYQRASGCIVHSVYISCKPSLFWVTSGLASSRDQVDALVNDVGRYKLVTRRGTVLAHHEIWGWKQPGDPPRLGYDYSTPLLHYHDGDKVIERGVRYLMENITTSSGVQWASNEYMGRIGDVIGMCMHVPALPVWHSLDFREKCKQEHREEKLWQDAKN